MKLLAGKGSKDAREEQIQAYAEFLEQKQWWWWFTLNMGSGRPSRRRTELKFKQWQEELRAKYGSDAFRYFRVIETGRNANNPHIHGLVGGLRNRRTEFERRWAQISGGDAQIKRYDPSKKARYYMMKEMSDDGNLDLDLDFDFGCEGDEE
jgi:hypothetical protein